MLPSDVNSFNRGRAEKIRKKMKTTPKGILICWTKLFWIDVLLYKNKISQGTLMVFLSFRLY